MAVHIEVDLNIKSEGFARPRVLYTLKSQLNARGIQLT